MKVYYILSGLTLSERDFFLDSIRDVQIVDDITELIQTRYYRVDKAATIDTTNNTVILETWMFLRSIWEEYGVSPSQVRWVYKDNMVILNDDLWMYDNAQRSWTKISNEPNIYFFTSRYHFASIFWTLWEEISASNPSFPKLITANKHLSSSRHEKIRYISYVYEKRDEIIGDFMLPLMYNRSIQAIRDILELWQKETNIDNIVIKKSWATDNGKHITLLNVTDYLRDDQKLDYLFLKYIIHTSEFFSDIYFVPFYDIDKEFRLYYIIDPVT